MIKHPHVPCSSYKRPSSQGYSSKRRAAGTKATSSRGSRSSSSSVQRRTTTPSSSYSWAHLSFAGSDASTARVRLGRYSSSYIAARGVNSESLWWPVAAPSESDTGQSPCPSYSSAAPPTSTSSRSSSSAAAAAAVSRRPPLSGISSTTGRISSVSSSIASRASRRTNHGDVATATRTDGSDGRSTSNRWSAAYSTHGNDGGADYWATAPASSAPSSSSSSWRKSTLGNAPAGDGGSYVPCGHRSGSFKRRLIRKVIKWLA